jgi:hypothetical protein
VFRSGISRPFHPTGNDKILEGATVTVSAAAWESFHKATLELAKSTALKQRLTDAFKRHLQDLPPGSLPGDLRPDFEALRQSMTHVRPAYGECAVVATVRKMSIGEADAIAARIVGILDALHRAPAASAKANGPTQGRTGDTGSSRIPTLISVNRA